MKKIVETTKEICEKSAATVKGVCKTIWEKPVKSLFIIGSLGCVAATIIKAFNKK